MDPLQQWIGQLFQGQWWTWVFSGVGGTILLGTIAALVRWLFKRRHTPFPHATASDSGITAGGSVNVTAQSGGIATVNTGVTVDVNALFTQFFEAHKELLVLDREGRQKLDRITSETSQVQQEEVKQPLFADEGQARITERESTIPIPSEPSSPVELRPGAQSSEEFAEKLNERLSLGSPGQISVPLLPDAERRLLEDTGNQFLTNLRRFISELEIDQAITLTNELEPWLELHSQKIAAPLAYRLYLKLVDIKFIQARHAPSDTDKRYHLDKAELLLRKAKDVSSQ